MEPSRAPSGKGMTPLPSPAPLYGDALARVHADGFEDAALRALPALLAQLKKAPPGPLLELGSGAGGVLAALLAAGYEAQGLEPSPAFRRLARARHGALPLRAGTAETAPKGPWAAILAMGEVLNYCAPDGAFEPWPEKLARLGSLLAPGGVLLFDLMVQGPEPLTGAGWREDEHWLVAHRFSERRGRGRREITTFLRRGKSWMRQDEVHEVVMPTVPLLERALTRAGLAYRLAPRWGRQALLPRRLAVEAWRRG